MNQENTTTTNSYLSFKLGEEIFAAQASKVLSILEMTKITELPDVPVYMKGIINLRGKVLPIIDLKQKMEMQETEKTINTCIVVLDILFDEKSLLIGVIVDSVLAVMDFENSEIVPLPSIGRKYESKFIFGVVNINESFVIILDLDTIFSQEEIANIRQNENSIN